jgi:hypothetical protein
MSSGKQLSESGIVRKLAAEICQNMTRKVIADLQRMESSLLPGEDSGFKNTWDEICVQVQYNRSFYWDAYDLTVRSYLSFHVENLVDFEREAVWLQTPEGEDWDCEDDIERNLYPVSNEDIVAYIANSFVYANAERWSNSRIRNYIDWANRRD